MAEYNDLFLRACRGAATERTPIWLMRQAGRYQPDYRALRQKHSMMELCTTPELAARVTLSPLNRFGFDAGIIFSDLTIMFTPMGVPFTLNDNQGPVMLKPVRSAEDVAGLRVLDPEEGVPFTLEAIRMVVREARVPLIGFAGAPFTLAAYMIEGKGSREYLEARKFMYAQPEAWAQLMEVLSQSVLNYLVAQVKAGAAAVQLFDSWVGKLSPHMFRRCVLPYVTRIVEGLKPLGVPIIYFGTGTATLLEAMAETGCSVVGVDWCTPLGNARKRIGYDRPVQGNLDPVCLLLEPDDLLAEADRVMAANGGRPGHIFNLGHGVTPGTPESNVERLVDFVHGWQPGE